MNKRIMNPLIVNIIPPSPEQKCVSNGRRIRVPVNAAWTDFTNTVNPSISSDTYDSVIVHVSDSVDMDEKNMVHTIDIKMNEIARTATQADKAVLNDASKDVWYFMNPPAADAAKAKGYAPSDETVLGKYESFADELSWQKHQSQVWGRMADMMPLSTKETLFMPNHLAQLTAPSRGLEKEDLSEFWSFKSNKVLSPSLMRDDMVGMPGIVGKEYEGFTIVPQKGEDGPVERPLNVRSINTVGMSGIAIPMANEQGDVPKYQIATDPSKINVMLKARAKDGVSIQKSEYFDKKKNQFKFCFTGGEPGYLHVESARPDGSVTFADIKGTFDTKMKADVKDLLVERGYELPAFIDRLQVVPNAKYIWQSKGTMVGSDKVSKIVSPSNAGFTMGREPKNGAEDYVVLVAEGALKGRIVAKYVDVTDESGKSFGDYIAKDSGIIVAQVPGVSKAFVESVKPIYDVYQVKGTYIAMDADGRENLAVANGINTAYHCLSECSPVKVMSWNPEQKGLDDALLAVAQKKITLEDMGLKFGPPEKLFPLEEAAAPNPYRLDGTRANKQEWRIEYVQDSKVTNDRIKELQEETKKRAAESLQPNTAAQKADVIQKGGEDLAKNLTDVGAAEDVPTK